MWRGRFGGARLGEFGGRRRFDRCLRGKELRCLSLYLTFVYGVLDTRFFVFTKYKYISGE